MRSMRCRGWCRRCRMIRIRSPLIRQLWRIRDIVGDVVSVLRTTGNVHFIEGQAEDVDEGRVSGETAFVEDSMQRDDEFLCSWVPEPPCLRTLRVADEDALARVRLECLPVLLAHEHVGQAAEDTEVRDIRLASVSLPRSVGDAAVQRRGRHAVARVDKGGDGVAPERGREL